MTKKQEEALKELEKAMKICKNAKLVFCGIDNYLFAVDRDIYNEASGEDKKAPAEFLNGIEKYEVKNINYLDSGGF